MPHPLGRSLLIILGCLGWALGNAWLMWHTFAPLALGITQIRFLLLVGIVSFVLVAYLELRFRHQIRQLAFESDLH